MTHPETRKMIKAEREGAAILGAGEYEFPENRVAACMIMGDSYVVKEVKKTVDSLKGAGIDKLFLAYNGRSRSTLTWLWKHLKKIDFPFVVQKFKWEDDFSLARQQSFDMVPKDEFDWIIWIDADDQLVCVKPLKEMFDELDPYTQGIYLRYDYSVDPDTEAVAVVQWRERILSTKVDWKWKYPVHEVATGPIGTQFARKDHAFIRHLRSPDEDRGARERNRRIIAKTLKEYPDDQRMQFYFANEAMAETEYERDPEIKRRLAGAAILAYKRYLSNREARKDDMYLAATRVGDLYLMKGDSGSAVDAYLNAIKIHAIWPDAYIGLARASMQAGDWTKVKDFADISMRIESPQTSSGITPLTYQYTPYILRGMANENLGHFEEAKRDYLKAAEVWNPEGGLLEKLIEQIDEKIAVTTKDKDERKSTRGTRSEKSIAFVTAPLPEPWHPRLEEESGAGGAETCIMRLAPRFAADGWRVAVFGTPGPLDRGIDENGVEWWNSEEYLPNEKFKVVISSRIPEVFGADVQADKKILWMHDVNVGPRMKGLSYLPKTIVGLTNWHVQHMSTIYNINPRNFAVIPNGIELELYDWSQKKESDGELRMIWSSSPDRGLAILISLWPTIKSMYPTARLDIFYGWNIIDKLIQSKDGRAGHLIYLKNLILNNIESLGGVSAGINQHGRIPQRELAKWQLNSHIWPYTTDFMETFCITAVEMQAAGVIPITSKLAALQETVANSNLLVDGWPLNADYQKRWIRTLTEVVEGSPEYQTELQHSGRNFAERFTWDAAYAKWNDLIRNPNV